MLDPSGGLPAAAPPPALIDNELQALVWLASALALGGFFGALRSALHHAHAGRVLARTSEARRERLEALLAKVDALAVSAGVLKIAFDLFFATIVLGEIQGDAGMSWGGVGLSLAIAVPTILLVTEALPAAIAHRYGDGLLSTFLPAFYVLQLPLATLVLLLDGLKRATLRVFRLKERPTSSRQIVEGLREVIEDTAITGDLDATEREMIENVMEFRDVDVAAVMTPRTEIHGVDLAGGTEAVVEELARCGHSRIPVFEGSLDSVIGTISARDIVQVVAERRMDTTALREILHPPFFVPETKPVSELLAEFRRQKIKIAIVLDEYGGTAGLVTLGDIIAELVGDIQDEFDTEEPQAVRHIEEGAAEVLASLHVTEVNEELDLDLPEEEDYETLGGFVLARFGRFPKPGERFVHGDVEFTVTQANERRVLSVLIKKLAPGAPG